MEEDDIRSQTRRILREDGDLVDQGAVMAFVIGVWHGADGVRPDHIDFVRGDERGVDEATVAIVVAGEVAVGDGVAEGLDAERLAAYAGGASRVEGGVS